MAINNYLFSPTSENPRGFSVPFEFAKLVAKIRNEIIHKIVTNNLIEKLEFPKPAKMSTL